MIGDNSIGLFEKIHGTGTTFYDINSRITPVTIFYGETGAIQVKLHIWNTSLVIDKRQIE